MSKLLGSLVLDCTACHTVVSLKHCLGLMHSGCGPHGYASYVKCSRNELEFKLMMLRLIH